MKSKSWFMFLLFATGVYACGKEMIETPFAGFQVPANFPAPIYHFSTNPVTRSGFELGRKLFYDPLLSRNSTISCGSCHLPSSAFTHHGHSVSHGIDDRLGTRNTPPVMNLAWYSNFMWDGGVFDLDLQPIAPLTNHVEMDETMGNVLTKLGADGSYPLLFKKAFGTEEITSASVLKALSQFMLMCVSSNSRYDSVMRKQNARFTAEEQKGYVLFQQKCGSCHTEPLFTDNSFRNNGIGPGINDDKGRKLVTLNDNDSYKFKVPSLRNLKYTAPYMHDGRFYTLEAVLEHYSNHVQVSPGLDVLLQKNGQKGIPMDANEKNSIIAFLETLNDPSFIKDKKLAEQ
ncbi:MAG TPA: cytochrome c peroxidase [Agriterribacter sp.]|nr:cytochrome c peroxidase [Agriterribacter sp.]